MTPRHLLEPGRLAGAALLKAQPDGRLIDMARGGNDRAFEAIVARYKGDLLRYCARILPDGRDEDAVQQVFINAYNALHSDTTPLALRSWLFGIAHNVSLNILRQRRSGHEPLEGHDPVDEAAFAAVERRERLREVLGAVAALPPTQRDAIVLRELEGRGHDEIARELGVTGGAARQLISRARSGVRAAAAAVVPVPLLMRLTEGSTGAAPTATRIAELTAGGGAATLTKFVATAAVGGALIGGAVKGPDIVTSNRASEPPVAQAADRAEASDDSPADDPGVRGDDRGGRGSDDGRRARETEDAEHRSGTDDDSGDDSSKSGPGGGDDGLSDDHSGDDRSGSNSGPGSGDGSGDDRSGSNSGPDSGSLQEDNSGPGSGSDDMPLQTTTTDPTLTDDHSGPGGGGTSGSSDTTESSGSGTSGSGSGTSGSGISGSSG